MFKRDYKILLNICSVILLLSLLLPFAQVEDRFIGVFGFKIGFATLFNEDYKTNLVLGLIFGQNGVGFIRFGISFLILSQIAAICSAWIKEGRLLPLVYLIAIGMDMLIGISLFFIIHGAEKQSGGALSAKAGLGMWLLIILGIAEIILFVKYCMGREA